MKTILFTNLFIILFTISSMYGCTEVQVQYVPMDLSNQISEKPLLPKIKATELQCLTNEVYQKLYDRERLIKEDALSCRAIIESTRGFNGTLK